MTTNAGQDWKRLYKAESEALAEERIAATKALLAASAANRALEQARQDLAAARKDFAETVELAAATSRREIALRHALTALSESSDFSVRKGT